MIEFTQEDATRWEYNCKDVNYTLEVAQNLQTIITARGEKFQKFHEYQQHKVAPALVNIMNRGIRIDLEKKEQLNKQLTLLMADVEKKLEFLLDEPFNPRSVNQMKAVFKDLLGIKLKIDKKSKAESCASPYMFQYLEEYPDFRVLISLILEYRSIGVFLKTFVGAKVDEDGRMRTAYNCAGTKTGRLSSRKNAFGFGANLANIPSKGKIKLKYALAELEEDDDSKEEVFIDEDSEGLTALPNCKEFFIPDEGKVFWNADYSGADAMVVAADANCDWLLKFFAAPPMKLYQYIASHYYQREILTTDKEYKIFKQFCHGCLTGEHEVLTQEGWVALKDFDWESEELAVWDADSKEIWFEKPEDFYIADVEASEDLYSIKGDSFEFLGTQNHRFPYMKSSGQIAKEEAISLNKTARIPYSGYFTGGFTNLDNNLVRLIVALQADGHVEYTDSQDISSFNFHFHKKRKYERLVLLLTALKIPFKENNYEHPSHGMVYNIRFKGYLNKYMKVAGWWLLNLSQNNLDCFVDELQYWDGSLELGVNHKRISVSTVSKETAEIYHTLIHLTGRASKIVVDNREHRKNSKDLYRISINNRNYYRTETGTRELVKHSGTRVYCPKTSTSYFMVKYNGHIYCSSNSHYGMKEEKAALNAGIPAKDAKKILAWYFGLCPEIPEWHKRIASDVKSKGYVENIFGRRMWFLNKDCPTLLNQAIAAIPQSTIADLTNTGLVNVEERFYKKESSAHVLMQVHDALAGQFDKEEGDKALKSIIECMEFELPYPTPLIIPADISTSELSYGHC